MNKLFFLLSILFFLTNACKKLERINPRDGIAGVTTSEAKQLDLSTLQISSTLTTIEGVAYVTQRGICWSTSPNPTTKDNFTNEGSGFGTFLSEISGLSANTTYYFRAFASNDLTTAYGNEVSFKFNAPSVLTKQATAISYTSVNIGCKLVSNGGYTIKEEGMLWDSFPGITEKNQKITANKPDFDYALSGLENGKTYYYRSFVWTEYGYVFGEELSFATLGYNTPSISTIAATSIGEYTASSGGKISSDGGLAIIGKGVCLSTSSNPTISDSKTSDGTGMDEFISKLSALNGDTKYYIRAYATNSKGTSYGDLQSFTTYAYYKPTITTNPITNITKLSATSGGTAVSDGGLTITAKGICWSTKSNPTITDSKTSNGNGIGNFTSQLTGLQIGTTYYVRAYATNAKGTNYGNEINFKTLSSLGNQIIDVDGNTYKTVSIGTQQWMAENLKVSKYSDGTAIPNVSYNTQWSNLTTGAWAYYENDAANNAKYGKLYNWYAVSKTSNGNKNVCPTGWHVPTDAEWTVLTDYLGGESVAGGKMKEVGTSNWNSPNTDATNTLLFTGLPGGFRYDSGYYNYIGNYGYWWSSSENNTSDAWSRGLNYYSGEANSYYGNKRGGLSVRCLRD